MLVEHVEPQRFVGRGIRTPQAASKLADTSRKIFRVKVPSVRFQDAAVAAGPSLDDDVHVFTSFVMHGSDANAVASAEPEPLQAHRRRERALVEDVFFGFGFEEVGKGCSTVSYFAI